MTALSPAEKTEEHNKAIPPPDVGLKPWLQVVGGFCLMFNNWGLVVAFGTFQSYYETSSIIDASPSAIAWIGSLQAFLLLFVAGLCGRLFDAGYLRHLLITGTFLIVFGLMMTSLVKEYYQAVLAQGICIGLGIGCTLVPSVGIPGTWFVKHRGLAVGLVTCGSAVAGIVNPIMLERLFAKVGFPWAVRTMGFISLATLSVSITLMRQRLPPRKGGAIFEIKALREPEFVLYDAGMLATLLGFYVFFNFVQAWVIASGLDTHGFSPFYFLSIMNGVSAIGRTLPNLISDKIGPLNVQAPCALVTGVLVYAWIGVHTIVPLFVVVVLYGLFSGGLISLPPAAVASMTRDMSTFGARMGVTFTFMSVGSLIGSPVSGAIIQGNGGNNYDAARIWSATTIVVGSLLMFASRMWVSRREGKLILKV